MALARIDRATGAVATSGIFPYAKTVARVPAGLWVAAGPGFVNETAAADTKWLSLVDPVTLSVKLRIHLPAQTGSVRVAAPQLAGASNLLWLGYGQVLYRLDPTTGRVLLTQSLPGTATSVSIDPSGHRLYVGVDVTPSQTSQDLVVESDALTGSRLASAETGGLALGGPQVAAAADGVWVSYATGMMGSAGHLSATGLALLSSPQYQQTNGIHVFVFGGTLWFVDGMLAQIACGNPLTGVIAASSQESGPMAVVADANGSYLGAFDGVGFLRPDPSCPH
jgi:outer membrane protein assembly factor BamB